MRLRVKKKSNKTNRHTKTSYVQQSRIVKCTSMHKAVIDKDFQRLLINVIITIVQIA